MSSVPSAPNVTSLLTIIQAATEKGLVAGNFMLTRPDGTQACSRPDAVSVLLLLSNSDGNSLINLATTSHRQSSSNPSD